MTPKDVLTEAINKLVSANVVLEDKIKNSTDQNKIDNARKELNKNNAMILDYKFRLEYE